MAAVLWLPQDEGLREICGLLEQHISPASNQHRIWQQLQHYSQFPDFNNYLVFILARAELLGVGYMDLVSPLHSIKRHNDDAINAWNLRKCSAAGLDTLSNLFGDEILPTLLPLIQALGPGFSQFPQPVFQRCINLIRTQQLAKVDHVVAGVQYDKGFIICSLDLLSGLAVGLGSGIESLVVQSNLGDLRLQCCMDEIADIRRNAPGLLGDLARLCPVHLHPHLSEFLNVAVKQLSAPEIKAAVSVATNACWAIGELAIKIWQHEGKSSETACIG